MQSVAEGSHIILKLEDGEGPLNCLSEALASSGANALGVEFGIGMLRDLTIGYFNGTDYVKRTIQEPMEIVALHGLVAPESTHLHCGLASRELSLIGGHLFEGTVNVVNELLLLKLDDVKIRRELNQSTGLMELQLE